MTRRLCRATVLAALLAAVGVLAAMPPTAQAKPRLLVGLFDDAQVYGNPGQTFPILASLRTKVLRVNLYWGGRIGAPRPAFQAPRFDDPADYGPSKQPSVGYAALSRPFHQPADAGRYSYALLQPWDYAGAQALK